MGAYVEAYGKSRELYKPNLRCATLGRVSKRNSNCVAAREQGNSRTASIGRVAKANKGATLRCQQ
jgi:hypothetical protein